MGYKQSRLTDFSFDYDWRIHLMNEPRDIKETKQASIWRWVRPIGQSSLSEYR